MTITEHPTQTPGRETVPWSWYSDPAILAREIERIFRCSWQYAGHLGELQGPGSYFPSAGGPLPIVITLDRRRRPARVRQRLPPPGRDRRDRGEAAGARFSVPITVDLRP